jgi:ferredoxin
MLTSQQVKQAARECGADLCGVAPVDRFEGAPRQQDPRYIFPDAKACIVLGFRIPRGYYRGIEEGTYFAAYPALGYGGMNTIYMPIVLQQMCCFIEDHGFEASPVPNTYPGTSIPFDKQAFDPARSRPVKPGLPHPDVLVDYRIAAFAAGLGEIGYSKMLLTPQFGPRQRLVMILTDAPLESDPIYEGPKLCDRCMACARECTAGAISQTETESVTVAGRKLEWGKLDCTKCSIGYRGGVAEFNPFMKDGADPASYAGKYCGRPELDALCGYPKLYNHNASLEGARGCTRACMVHLERRGVLSNKFANPFRRRPGWKLPPGGASGRGPSTQDGTE